MKRVLLKEVSRVYGRAFALHRVSMQLRAGVITALVGGNGAGKTTLLNILATLDRPTSGTVDFGGATFDQLASRGRRNIGWVSHDSLVYDDLTGAENLQFYAQMYNLPAPQELAANWLERVGLSDVADRQVAAYSRGMRQRLSVARALLHEPSLVLLDEPLTGLDRDGRETLVSIFQELRDRDAIVVVISHDLHIAREFVDEVAVLNRGKLTYHGTDDVVEAFVAHA